MAPSPSFAVRVGEALYGAFLGSYELLLSAQRLTGSALNGLFRSRYLGVNESDTDCEASFRRLVEQAKEEDMEDLRGAPLPSLPPHHADSFCSQPRGPSEAGIGLVTTGLTDNAGRPVLLICGRALDQTAVGGLARLERFLAATLDETAGAEASTSGDAAAAGTGSYSVLYCHSKFDHAESPGRPPQAVPEPPLAGLHSAALTHIAPPAGLLWLCRLWERLPARLRRSLHRLYIVHSDLTLRTSLNLVGPMLSDGLIDRCDVPLRIEFLFPELDERLLRAAVPAFVWEHDAELEEHPLVDYGIVADKSVVPPGFEPSR